MYIYIYIYIYMYIYIHILIRVIQDPFLGAIVDIDFLSVNHVEGFPRKLWSLVASGHLDL